MCLLTFFPAEVQPNMERLEFGADSNPDGHGWAIIAHGEVTIGHSMNADQALTMFELARANLPDDGPALFHSRIATAGSLDTFNCHPFHVGGDRRTVIAHNGILPRSAQPGPKELRSDTHLFADKWLPKQRYGHFLSRSGRKRLRRWLGAGNKMAMLTVDPIYTQPAYILNEHLGEWNEDVWYSNDSYRELPWYKSYGSYSSYSSYGATTYRSRWTDTDLASASGIVIGNREPKELTTGRDGHITPLFSDEELSNFDRGDGEGTPFRSDIECGRCHHSGHVSVVTGMCWLCETCQFCGQDFDGCNCPLRPTFGTKDDDIHSVASWEID